MTIHNTQPDRPSSVETTASLIQTVVALSGVYDYGTVTVEVIEQ